MYNYFYCTCIFAHTYGMLIVLVPTVKDCRTLVSLKEITESFFPLTNFKLYSARVPDIGHFFFFGNTLIHCSGSRLHILKLFKWSFEVWVMLYVICLLCDLCTRHIDSANPKIYFREFLWNVGMPAHILFYWSYQIFHKVIRNWIKNPRELFIKKIHFTGFTWSSFSIPRIIKFCSSWFWSVGCSWSEN